MALKLARYATGRHKTISMWDSFHGASLDAISIGGEQVRALALLGLLRGWCCWSCRLWSLLCENYA